MIHRLETDKRVVTFDDETGSLSIPANKTDKSVHLTANETDQLLTWLYDQHRTTLYQLTHNEVPAN